ncbi:MAG TPA: hypothetical protein PLU22_25230, partial [Polyangiaceae bacterium]|nr:hypothetical protein [Polyangiaceae bacterium]
RTEVATHALALEVRRTIGALPATLAALDPLAVADTPDPTVVRPNEVEVLSQAERLLLGEMVPTIDEEVRAIASNVVAVSNRAHEAHQVVSYALARDDEDRERRDEVAREAVERALVLIEQQCALLDDHARNVPSRARELAEAGLSELDHTVLERGRAVPIGSAVAPLLSRARRVVGRAYLAGRRRYERATERVAQVLSGSLSRELYQRYYKQRFDAIEVNDFVANWRVAETIPRDYAELFSEEPLVGPRFFVEHQDALHALISAERAWLNGGPASALVVGAHGSGRTSLVNQCKLKLGTPRLLRPQPLQWRRDIGIFQALGLALGARHGAGALTRALTATRTAVLLDDLENWFVPDPSGLADLERFLDLVVRTRHDVFWIATIEQETLALLEEAVPVTNAFGRIVRLAPSRAEALARVIEGRHVLSGRPLVFKAGPLSTVLERIPALRERDVFFRVLARASGGNLARALALWIRSVELDADGAVWP